MSKAAIHRATPMEMGRMVGAHNSSVRPDSMPVMAPQPWTSAAMATHAPAGARPRHSPNQKWHPHVKRFMYG